MLKWISFFLLFILIIFCTFTGYLYTYRVDFLSLALTQAIDTPVRMKSVDISQNGLIIKGLRLQNPSDWEAKNALTVDKISLKMNWTELLKTITGINSQKILIKKIKINTSEMTTEFVNETSSKSNWNQILAKIAATKDEPSSRKFEIKKVTITDTTVEVKYQILPKMIVKPSSIAKIELKNLGNEHSFTVKKIFYFVLKTLVESTTKEHSVKPIKK